MSKDDVFFYSVDFWSGHTDAAFQILPKLTDLEIVELDDYDVDTNKTYFGEFFKDGNPLTLDFGSKFTDISGVDISVDFDFVEDNELEDSADEIILASELRAIVFFFDIIYLDDYVIDIKLLP